MTSWIKRRWMHKPGQAMAETVLLLVAMLGVGGALVHFFPDAINSLQIYMDGFYFIFAMPIP